MFSYICAEFENRLMTRLFTFLTLLLANIAFSQVDSTGMSQDGRSNKRLEVNLNPNPQIHYVVPPVGFDTSGYFNGYVDLKRHSAIIIQEMQKITPAVGKEAFQKKMDYFAEAGMKVLGSDDFVTAKGVSGFYLKLNYENKGVVYIRYLVYVGVANSLFLDVVFPESEKLDEQMINCFRSITYDL